MEGVPIKEDSLISRRLMLGIIPDHYEIVTFHVALNTHANTHTHTEREREKEKHRNSKIKRNVY